MAKQVLLIVFGNPEMIANRIPIPSTITTLTQLYSVSYLLCLLFLVSD